MGEAEVSPIGNLHQAVEAGDPCGDDSDCEFPNHICENDFCSPCSEDEHCPNSLDCYDSDEHDGTVCGNCLAASDDGTRIKT